MAEDHDNCSDGEDANNDNDDDDDELLNLHPYLFPIMKSSKSGNYICAYRSPHEDTDDGKKSDQQPWPIVEAKAYGPGMKLVSLNSEHLMRRIACEIDFNCDGNE